MNLSIAWQTWTCIWRHVNLVSTTWVGSITLISLFCSLSPNVSCDLSYENTNKINRNVNVSLLSPAKICFNSFWPNINAKPKMAIQVNPNPICLLVFFVSKSANCVCDSIKFIWPK